jgi:hypothetical protein
MEATSSIAETPRTRAGDITRAISSIERAPRSQFGRNF